MQDEAPYVGVHLSARAVRGLFDAQGQAAHGDVSRVEPRRGGHVGQVVAEGAVGYGEAAHAVEGPPRLKASVAQLGPSEPGADAHAVAGHGEAHAGVGNAHAAHADVPGGGRGGRVGLRRVAQGDAYVGIGQLGKVYTDAAFRPVDAVGRSGQTSYVAADVRVGDIAFRVERRAVELEAVHVGFSVQQGEQAYVETQRAHGGKRVSALYGVQPVQGQVERKGQADTSDAHVHAQRGRELPGHALHHVILYGRYVKYDGQ